MTDPKKILDQAVPGWEKMTRLEFRQATKETKHHRAWHVMQLQPVTKPKKKTPKPKKEG